MQKISPQEIQRLVESIKTLEDLKNKIFITLNFYKSSRSALYKALITKSFKLGIIKNLVEFKDIVEDVEYLNVKYELDRCLVQYHKTEDFYFKRWLKYKLLKKFPQFITNEQTFEEYNQQLFNLSSPESQLQVETIEDFNESLQVDFLVQNLIPQRGLSLLAGPPKMGKSSLACEIAYSVATGKPLFNQLPTKQGLAIVVSLDESKDETGRKYIARGFKNSSEAKKNIKFLWKLNFDNLRAIEQLLKKYKPSLIIFDSLKRLTASLKISENNPKFGDLLSDLSSLLKKYHCAGLIIHHSNKSKNGSIIGKIRGSSAITGATSVNLLLEKKGEQLTLTATGRDIQETEYHLVLNERNDWQTSGIYHLESTTPEIKPTQTTTPTPTSTPAIAPTTPEIKPSKKAKKATTKDKIKTIVRQSEKLTKEQIIEEAVKIAIKEEIAYKALKEMLNSNEIVSHTEVCNERIEVYYSYSGIPKQSSP